MNTTILDIILAAECVAAVLGGIFGALNSSAITNARYHEIRRFRFGAVALFVMGVVTLGLWIWYALATGVWQFVAIQGVGLVFRVVWQRIERRKPASKVVAIIPAKIGTVIRMHPPQGRDRDLVLIQMMANGRDDSVEVTFATKPEKMVIW